MATKIPDELKSQTPPTIWGKILLATPIVMAVLATMLAGLASGEMGKAQYSRSLAAQLQSKAGDQWGLFQAKKLRGVSQRNTLDLLDSIANPAPLDLDAIEQAAARLPEAIGLLDEQVRDALGRLPKDTASAKARKSALEDYLGRSAQRLSEAQNLKTAILTATKAPVAASALAAAQRGQLPEAGGEAPMDRDLKALIHAIENLRPDAEIASLTARVDDGDVESALQAAKGRLNNFDNASKSISQWIEQMERHLSMQAALLRGGQALALPGLPNAEAADSLYRGFVAGRLRYSAARYDAEARLNQALGTFYEVHVRKGNLAADRHHARSERFFYGMLGAQLAVIIATFAIAARKRNFLWGLAAAAGMVAVTFGVYVYLYV